MYNYTEEQIRKAEKVVLTYPGFGTLTMRVENVHDGTVEGLVWDDQGYSHYMPDDWRGGYEYMNFPITCVRECYGTRED